MKTLTDIENPYWDEVAPLFTLPPMPYGTPLSGPAWRRRMDAEMKQMRARDDFVRRYAWAVPDPASLDFVAQWLGEKAIEIGAGTGYWAWQLTQRGVDIIAVDSAPPDRVDNGYVASRDEVSGKVIPRIKATYHEIVEGTYELLPSAPSRTLFLCWPPCADDMAYQCLLSFRGSRLVYIGEGNGGCNGDAAFFEELEKSWREVAAHRIVQWYGINDYITVYERIQ